MNTSQPEASLFMLFPNIRKLVDLASIAVVIIVNSKANTYLNNSQTCDCGQCLIRNTQRERFIDPILDQVHANFGQADALYAIFWGKMLLYSKCTDEERDVEKDRIFGDQWGEEFKDRIERWGRVL
jgi:hypothetical protein